MDSDRLSGHSIRFDELMCSFHNFLKLLSKLILVYGQDTHFDACFIHEYGNKENLENDSISY